MINSKLWGWICWSVRESQNADTVIVVEGRDMNLDDYGIDLGEDVLKYGNPRCPNMCKTSFSIIFFFINVNCNFSLFTHMILDDIKGTT